MSIEDLDLRPEALAARLTKHADLCIGEINFMVFTLQSILNIIDAKNPADSILDNGYYL
ncbi:MAG: hypothetical protein HOM15_07030 [Gammaproteobacteria bacterium]|jgi:hypothetical protein|nr:hypothetical protein [Gammaproteobacteria bacterium]